MRFSAVIFCGLALAICIVAGSAQYDLDEYTTEKRTPMRNALVRFGRAGMRNALVRFGKRAIAFSDEYPIIPEYALEAKRNGAPQPFVRFGRSAGRIDHMHDILSTLQKIDQANSQ